MSIKSKIANLRKLMYEQQLAAYIIPSNDPHQSEYVADHWKEREWISGFTGSAGTVVITNDHAGLWTDSRYFLQAEKQLSKSEIVLHKQKIAYAPQHLYWLIEHLPKGAKIGCNGLLFSAAQVRQMAKLFYESDIQIDSEQDLISPLWKKRPALPLDEIIELDKKIIGQSRLQKIKAIRRVLQRQGADFHLVSTLDDIAWIFNIRGSDVACNPVAIAYALIGQEICYLFIDPRKVSEQVKLHLRADGILLKAYDDIKRMLTRLPNGKTILVDYQKTSISLYNYLPAKQIIHGATISTHLKGIKNKVEIENIDKAMIKDGIALTKLYRWLESTLKKRTIPETEVAEQLITFRKAQGDYFGESFAAIVGYKGNGAIIHYRAEKETCANIEKGKGILLIDSGGQYLQGTTDITRTITLGKATANQKKHFTLVLKGHIALAQINFPKGTRGNQLDTLARQSLWNHGLNYGHGTGHGVGYFLNVHEGPQGISSAASGKAATPFEVGMLSSNEPGFYLPNEYGIRIENLLLTVASVSTDFGEFLKFKTLTLFPIDLKLVDKKLLNKEELKWLNDYHQTVFEKLSPSLNKAEKKWLERK
ncbi:MAG TPA: aminopeptidase P family protein, partial [Saprospiraceae bacterium]|nr:aminopeptidase P family protein [Saprospiraceae bacterium]